MGIKRNPFEVGYSGEDAWRVVSERCTCCAIPFTLRYNVADKPLAPVCEHCASHVKIEDEPIERRAARAEDHEARVRELLVTMSKRNVEEREKARRAQGWADHTQFTIENYRSAVNTISDLHIASDANTCSCGKKGCPTRKVLDATFIFDRSQ